MLQLKFCMLGSFAVGKTSLVSRFVHGIFSEKYLTTLGVKIDKKELLLEGRDVTMVLWDIHGEDEFQKVRRSYLRGTSAYLLVMDGTRPDTVETAEYLHDLARSEVGDVPFALLLNKSDLRSEWRIDTESRQRLEAAGGDLLETSAKTGENVAEAFDRLAREAIRGM